jgi:hypothetical protein
MYTAIISFALGLIAGWLITLNNVKRAAALRDKAEAEAAKDIAKGKELLDALKHK